MAAPAYAKKVQVKQVTIDGIEPRKLEFSAENQAQADAMIVDYEFNNDRVCTTSHSVWQRGGVITFVDCSLAATETHGNLEKRSFTGKASGRNASLQAANQGAVNSRATFEFYNGKCTSHVESKYSTYKNSNGITYHKKSVVRIHAYCPPRQEVAKPKKTSKRKVVGPSTQRPQESISVVDLERTATVTDSRIAGSETDESALLTYSVR